MSAATPSVSEARAAKAAKAPAKTPAPDTSGADEIAALKAKLAETELRLEESEAQSGRTAPSNTSPEVEPGVFMIHFVTDGVTLLRKMWYRGEELRVETDSEDWTAITDTKGWNLFEIADDPVAQTDRYGQEMFRPGPWPYQLLSDEDLQSGEGFASLEEAERARRRMQRERSGRGPGSGSGMTQVPMQGSPTQSISP